MTVSIDDIAKQMLVLLPDDGTPVLNRVMHIMVTQALATDIRKELYDCAVEQLKSNGNIDSSRGRGGKIHLKNRDVFEETISASSATWSEAKLMPFVQKFLNGQIQKMLQSFEGTKCLSYDTSRIGKTGIQWSRPDFTLLSARPLPFLSDVQLDVHSFELKAENGISDRAVFEALAHRRFTNFSHLICHLPKKSKLESRWDGIRKLCKEHGIGLIRIYDPAKPSEWEILTEPDRKEKEAAVIDKFLRERLQETQRKEILSLIGRPHHER